MLSAATELYTVSLHDALPISDAWARAPARLIAVVVLPSPGVGLVTATTCLPDSSTMWRSPRYCSASNEEGERKLTKRSLGVRSEEHTSELQSLRHLVCRLPLQ